jgi:hypothetical protein
MTLPVASWQALGAFRYIRPASERRIDTSHPRELVKRWQGPAGSCAPAFGHGGRDAVAAHQVALHGPSSFCDWAGNETHFPPEIAEHCLAYVIGDKHMFVVGSHV